MNNIDFYFSIGSTYTYLSVTRILDVEKKHNVKFKRMKDNDLLKIFKSSGKLSRFTELVSTFMSHYKSNELNEKKVKDKILTIIGDNNKRRCLVFLNLFIKHLLKSFCW